MSDGAAVENNTCVLAPHQDASAVHVAVVGGDDGVVFEVELTALIDVDTTAAAVGAAAVRRLIAGDSHVVERQRAARSHVDGAGGADGLAAREQASRGDLHVRSGVALVVALVGEGSLLRASERELGVFADVEDPDVIRGHLDCVALHVELQGFAFGHVDDAANLDVLVKIDGIGAIAGRDGVVDAFVIDPIALSIIGVGHGLCRKGVRGRERGEHERADEREDKRGYGAQGPRLGVPLHHVRLLRRIWLSLGLLNSSCGEGSGA